MGTEMRTEHFWLVSHCTKLLLLMVLACIAALYCSPAFVMPGGGLRSFAFWGVGVDNERGLWLGLIDPISTRTGQLSLLAGDLYQPSDSYNSFRGVFRHGDNWLFAILHGTRGILPATKLTLVKVNVYKGTAALIMERRLSSIVGVSRDRIYGFRVLGDDNDFSLCSLQVGAPLKAPVVLWRHATSAQLSMNGRLLLVSQQRSQRAKEDFYVFNPTTRAMVAIGKADSAVWLGRNRVALLMRNGRASVVEVDDRSGKQLSSCRTSDHIVKLLASSADGRLLACELLTAADVPYCRFSAGVFNLRTRSIRTFHPEFAIIEDRCLWLQSEADVEELSVAVSVLRKRLSIIYRAQ